MVQELLKTKEDIYECLRNHNIAFKIYDHKPALTIEALRQDPGKLDHSAFTKTLAYVDKKKTYHMFIVHENSNVSKNFWKTLNTNYNNI